METFSLGCPALLGGWSWHTFKHWVGLWFWSECKHFHTPKIASSVSWNKAGRGGSASVKNYILNEYSILPPQKRKKKIYQRWSCARLKKACVPQLLLPLWGLLHDLFKLLSLWKSDEAWAVSPEGYGAGWGKQGSACLVCGPTWWKAHSPWRDCLVANITGMWTDTSDLC